MTKIQLWGGRALHGYEYVAASQLGQADEACAIAAMTSTIERGRELLAQMLEQLADHPNGVTPDNLTSVVGLLSARFRGIGYASLAIAVCTPWHCLISAVGECRSSARNANNEHLGRVGPETFMPEPWPVRGEELTLRVLGDGQVLPVGVRKIAVALGTTVTVESAGALSPLHTQDTSHVYALTLRWGHNGWERLDSALRATSL